MHADRANVRIGAPEGAAVRNLHHHLCVSLLLFERCIVHPLIMSQSSHKAASDEEDGPIEVKDDSKWTEGDFSLISSDGWKLKIWSYHLISARYVSGSFQARRADLF